MPIRVRVWLRVKQENDYYEFRQENDLPESCLQESYLKIHFRRYITTLIVNLVKFVLVFCYYNDELA